MSEPFYSFVLSLFSYEVHVRDWCERVTGSVKPMAILPLSLRVWLEHKRGRHFSRIKLSYEISPRIVSENTALRLIEKFIDRGYLAECRCHRESNTSGIKPTRKFLKEFEDVGSRMIRDFNQYGFVFKPERVVFEDFVIWSDRRGDILDAVDTERWLGVEPANLIGENLEIIFSDEWISGNGGRTAFQKGLITTFDQMVTDGRHVILTPVCVNRKNNMLIHTKAVLTPTHRAQHSRGKYSEPVRRSAYEVLKDSA